ncbi:alpha/beta hydrolase fold-domain-containing protein, partial [Mycena sp. CBHHK59/15]
PENAYVVKDQVAVEDGAVTVRCTTPTPTPAEGERAAFPVLFWIYGGGWVAGTLDADDFHLRIISVAPRVSIASVDYRHAPEHPFPTGLHDCYAALKWVPTNAARALSGSLARGFIVVGGVSAGGNLAAAIAHRARDDPFFADKHPPTGHLLQVPALVRAHPTPVVRAEHGRARDHHGAHGRLLRRVLSPIRRYLGGPPHDPALSPLLASHACVAPAYVRVCGLEALRAEALFYARLLSDVGVAARVDVYPGVPHGFHVGFPSIKAAERWEADFRAGLAWLLEAGGSRDSGVED